MGDSNFLLLKQVVSCLNAQIKRMNRTYEEGLGVEKSFREEGILVPLIRGA